MFLPPNVTNDQSGITPLNPILAALSGGAPATQPAPAAVPGQPAAASPAPAGGGFLSSLFGGGAGASSATGNPIGNALVNAGGHLLLPLIGSLLGGKTPEQQRLGAAQAAAAADAKGRATGIAGLDEAIQGGGSANQILHRFLSSDAGKTYFVTPGTKMADVMSVIKAAMPGADQTAEQKNFEYFLKIGGVSDQEARARAALNKSGLIKIIPRTITGSDGKVQTTGQYDEVNLVTGKSTPITAQAAAAGMAEAPETAPATPGAPAVPGVPTSGAAAMAAPAPATAAAVPTVPDPHASIIPAAPAGTTARPSASIAETGGLLGKGVLATGSLLSNVNPAFYPKETAKNTYTIDRIEATVPKILSSLKGSRGSNAVIKPLQELLNLDKKSPQEQLQTMIAAAQWAQDTYAYNANTIKTRAGTKAAEDANGEQDALQQLYDTLPPVHTQIETDAQGHTTTILGMNELLDQMHNRSVADSPAGRYVGDLPNTAQKYVDTGKALIDQGANAVGLPEPPAGGKTTPPTPLGPPPALKPGESRKYGNAIIKRLN